MDSPPWRLLAAELSRVEIPDFASSPHDEFAFSAVGLFEPRTVQQRPGSVKHRASIATEMDACSSVPPAPGASRARVRCGIYRERERSFSTGAEAPAVESEAAAPDELRVRRLRV